MHRWRNAREEIMSVDDLLKDLTPEQRTQLAARATEVMDVKDLAAYTKQAVQTIYNRVHRNEIPHFHQGARVYFFRDEIEAYLRSMPRTRPPRKRRDNDSRR